MYRMDVGSVRRISSRGALLCLAGLVGVVGLAACDLGPISLQGGQSSSPSPTPIVASSSADPAGSPSTGPSPVSQDQQQGFADCMRAHGAPLAAAGSGPTIGSAPKIDQGAIQKALAACKSQLPASAGQQQGSPGGR
jgi:hypothetical protein